MLQETEIVESGHQTQRNAKEHTAEQGPTIISVSTSKGEVYLMECGWFVILAKLKLRTIYAHSDLRPARAVSASRYLQYDETSRLIIDQMEGIQSVVYNGAQRGRRVGLTHRQKG
jgi:hypothetical protein